MESSQILSPIGIDLGGKFTGFAYPTSKLSQNSQTMQIQNTLSS
ncbi:hypothetical protein ABXK18_00130 [Legionella pneumophila 130b]